MAEYPKMPLWTDAYLGDTTHLTTIEHGAFLLLLISMWRAKGQRLHDDDKMLAKYARLTTAQWARIRPTIARLCLVKDGFWYSPRLSREFEAVKQYRKSQKEKADARWLKENDNEDAEASARHEPGNAPNPNPKEEPLYPKSLFPFETEQGAPLRGDEAAPSDETGAKEFIIKHAGDALAGIEQNTIKGAGLTACEHPGEDCGEGRAKKPHFLHDAFPGIFNAEDFAEKLPASWRELLKVYEPVETQWHKIIAIGFWDHWVGLAPGLKSGPRFKKQNWLWAFEHSCREAATRRGVLTRRRAGAM